MPVREAPRASLAFFAPQTRRKFSLLTIPLVPKYRPEEIIVPQPTVLPNCSLAGSLVRRVSTMLERPPAFTRATIGRIIMTERTIRPMLSLSVFVAATMPPTTV